MQGDIDVPPGNADGWRLKAGTNDEAGKADLIVLGTAYEQAWLDTVGMDTYELECGCVA